MSSHNLPYIRTRGGTVRSEMKYLPAILQRFANLSLDCSNRHSKKSHWHTGKGPAPIRFPRIGCEQCPAPLARRKHGRFSLNLSGSIKNICDYFGDLPCEIRRHRIAYLVILRCSWSLESIIIRKSLQPRGFSDCQAPTLHRIVVNKIVPIFRDMRSDSSSRLLRKLNPKSI